MSSEKLTTDELKKKLAEEAHELQKNSYKFPTEEVTLPSKGLVYEKDSLLASGVIEMKYMSAKEEDILTSTTLIKNRTVLDKLFQSLIVTPIKYNDLLLGDKNKIMFAARILGYGKMYNFKYTCPSCGFKENELEIDLNTLTEKELDEKDLIELNRNEFLFTLPESKRKIKFKLLTHGDYQKIQLEINSLKKFTSKSGVSPDSTTTLKYTIIEVDGETDIKKIINFVDNELLAIDSKELRKEIKRVSPDVNLKFDFICQNTGECDFEDEIDLPLNVDFFWPQA